MCVMTENAQRAHLLYAQGRHDMAEQEIRRILAQQPDDADAHAFLSLCLIERQQYKEAQREAREGVRLGPDQANTHHVLGFVLFRSDRHDEALVEAKAAVSLNPFNPDYFSLLSAIHFERRNWPDALDAAERGLAIDAEHVRCANLRAMALAKLGRRSEAGATIGAALQRNPEDPLTHANQGWTLLHAGEHAKAMEHFREALRLDPNLDWARVGIVEALKARNFIYRWMLLYFFWMSRLSGRAQWAIILGGVIGSRVLRDMAGNHPDWAPALWAVFYAYVVFAVMTWLADPLFNLLLRLNRFGRLVLSKQQTIAANCIGGLLATALVCLAIYLAGGGGPFAMAAIQVGVLALPLSGALRCPAGWPRVAMLGGCGALAVLALAEFGLGISLVQRPATATEGQWLLLNTLRDWFVMGVLGCTIIANVLMGVRVRR